MTLNKIAEILAERQGRQLDVPFKKLLEELIVIHTARILTNAIQKNPAQKKFYAQSIIVEVEEVDKDDCEEVAECPCENVLRSKNKLPNPLNGVNIFDYVGSIGGATAYGWTTFAAEQYLSTSTVTGRLPRYTWLNGYIYIFNEKNAEKIRVEDVFPDRRKLANFKCSTEESAPLCYTETSDFITDEAIAQIVIENILTKEFRFQPPQDDIEIKTDKNV